MARVMKHDNKVKKGMKFSTIKDAEVYYIPQYLFYIRYGLPKCCSCGESFNLAVLLHTEFCSEECSILHSNYIPFKERYKG